MVKLSQPQQFLAQERTIVEKAYPGDIIGVFDPGIFGIGDSLSDEKMKVQFEDFPVFPPENFCQSAAKGFSEAETICQRNYSIGTGRRYSGL